MPTTIRFHFDENVSNAVALGLRQRDIDVTTTAEQGLLGVSDLGQLEFVRVERRVLFTQDADFLRLHQAGTEHPGLVFCRKDSRDIR